MKVFKTIFSIILLGIIGLFVYWYQHHKCYPQDMSSDSRYSQEGIKSCMTFGIYKAN